MAQNYAFDTVFPRRECGSIKWNFARNSSGTLPEGSVPMTVADMEFKSPPAVRQALSELAEFGMWGYTMPTQGCLEAVCGWFARRHGWETKAEWMVQTVNVVAALGGAVRAFTQPGDGIIIQTPVYTPFYRTVTGNGRRLIENPLIREGMDYRMDLNDLAEKAKGAKMLILCSPHNPVGRVWSREELEGLRDICRENGVIVVADEIHCDLIHAGYQHIPYGTLGDETCVICTSASKTFSFAGLGCANIFIPNGEMREKFRHQRELDGFGTESTFGMRAMEVAYRECDGWLDAALAYIWGNYEYLKEFLAEKLPAVGISPLQGTYLAWTDMSGFGLAPEKLRSLLEDEAALFLGDGSQYGPDSCQGFMRFNLAVPRSALVEGLERLLAAAEKRGLV